MGLTEPKRSGLAARTTRARTHPVPEAQSAVESTAADERTNSKRGLPSIADHVRVLHENGDDMAGKVARRPAARYVSRTLRFKPEQVEFLKSFLESYNANLPRGMAMSLDELGRVLVELFRQTDPAMESVTHLRGKAA